MRHVRRNSERGSSLVFLAVSAAVLLGSLGLAFDLGRRFIVQTQLQSFVDAAALAAISQMDGTQRGIQNANSVATSGPFGTRNPTGYYFDSKPVTGVQTLYAKSLNGPYDDYATAVTPPTNTYAFVKVTASAGVPVSFLPVIRGIPTTMNAVATATAGQMAQSGITYGGSAPFMPDAHDASDKSNFGFTPGGEYTLKWGNSSSNGKGKGKGNTSAGTDCTDDLDWDNPNPTSQHDFVDVGQGNSNAGTRSSIMYGGFPKPNTTPSSISVGSTLDGVPGNRGTSIFDALQSRVNQDTDSTSTTYAQYTAGGRGNGRRIITVPIGDPNTWSGNGNGSFDVVGFANFFLETSYNGTSGPICAIYIGPASLNGTSSGKTDLTKVYFNVLYKKESARQRPGRVCAVVLRSVAGLFRRLQFRLCVLCLQSATNGGGERGSSRGGV